MKRLGKLNNRQQPPGRIARRNQRMLGGPRVRKRRSPAQEYGPTTSRYDRRGRGR